MNPCPSTGRRPRKGGGPPCARPRVAGAPVVTSTSTRATTTGTQLGREGRTQLRPPPRRRSRRDGGGCPNRRLWEALRWVAATATRSPSTPIGRANPPLSRAYRRRARHWRGASRRCGTRRRPRSEVGVAARCVSCLRGRCGVAGQAHCVMRSSLRRRRLHRHRHVVRRRRRDTGGSHRRHSTPASLSAHASARGGDSSPAER